MPHRTDQSPPSDWETLNAFADGELAPVEQRVLAERLATSPETAERLRSIVRLKQGLRGLPADVAPPLPSLSTAPRQRWHRAAAIAAALVIAAAVAFTPILLRRDASDAFLSASMAAHEQFASAPAQPAAIVAPAAALPVANELSRLGLQPVWQTASASGEVRIGFIGARGCRLSLHVSSHDEPAPAPAQADAALTGWNAGGRGYLLIATGMPQARFEMIAGFIKALTSEPADKVEPLRTALQNEWRNAQPCLA
ncbi:anti-sigma factor family protein [Bosea sp. NPDC003192]|uniref:anti-sigma factor family protein n=1 Tax=Bosea sp. NPDC003192 TaxID=3390551 RepID=UPI003D086AF3